MNQVMNILTRRPIRPNLRLAGQFRPKPAPLRDFRSSTPRATHSTKSRRRRWFPLQIRFIQ